MALGHVRAPPAVFRALARTGLTSLGAAVLAAWTGAVASIPLALGAAPPSSCAAAACTRDGDVLKRPGPNPGPWPSKVGAVSMLIPIGFLGSPLLCSPLLWSCASA